MKVTFVKKPGQRDRIYVQRDDGTETSWSFPSYGRGLPHDLVHLLVEAEFGLGDGIWARVAAGADLDRINAQANQAGGKIADKYRALGDDLSGVLASEALAALSWGMDWVTDAERLASLQANWASLDNPALPEVTEADITQARARLDAVRARWNALGATGAMAFAWPGGEVMG